MRIGVMRRLSSTEQDMMAEYEELKAKIQQLVAEGKLDPRPSREQRIDFAYGNAKLSNPAVTLEMAIAAVDAEPEA